MKKHVLPPHQPKHTHRKVEPYAVSKLYMFGQGGDVEERRTK